MPNIPLHNVKRPWIHSTIPEGKRQTEKDNSFYHTRAWKAITKQMAIDEPLCRECKKKGIIKASTVTDHIKPVRQGGKMYDLNNLQRLCDSCHASKSGREAH